MNKPSKFVPLQVRPADDDDSLKLREAEELRVEYRRVTGRINFRRRRGQMFLALLVLTLATIFVVAVATLSPSDWLGSQQSRFTQMTTLIFLLVAATPIAAYLARRYDRQRERVRVASSRQREILQRLAQLDDVAGGARHRRRRRRKQSWAWRIAHPAPFNRPPLESMDAEQLKEAADALGNLLTEERSLRALAYAHAVITGALTIIIAFGTTLLGPAYLQSFLTGKAWGGGAGPDPLMFWLTLTIGLVVIGGVGSHRVSVLRRRARAYHDRLAAVERALWDVRVLLRERREKL